MKNIINLQDFFNFNNLRSDSEGNYKFSGKVEYFSKIKNVVEYTEVRIIMHGYRGGKVSIAECGELNINEFHLDFEERYQNYEYDKDTKKLIIKGNSPKMRGKYEVKISLT